MEVSALQMSVDSSGVVKGSGDLNKLSSSAQKAAADAAKVEKAMGGVNTAASRAAAAVNKEAVAMDKAATAAWEKEMAARKLAVADQQAANRAWAAQKAQESNANSSRKASMALGQAATAAQSTATGLGAIMPAAKAAQAGLDGVTKAANSNVGAMKANTSNIAAQFQDIGVTAAMGMNPMMIALQQGTQLSAVLQSGMGSLGAAFAQIISPLSLMTIGLVAASAALIQMVNWTDLAISALNFLADNLVAIAPYAVAAAAALALFYAPAILAGIASLTVAIGVGLVKALETVMWRMIALAVMNPWGAFVVGIGIALAALFAFRDWFTKVLGVDIIGAIKDGINFIIGGFVGAFNAVKATWSILPQAIGDVAIQAANVTIQAIQNMVNGAVSLINGLTSSLPFGIGDNLKMGDVSFGKIANPYAGMAQAVNDVAAASVKAAQSVDWVGKAIQGIKNGASAVAGQFREWAKALGATDEKTKGGKAGSAGKSQAESLADILKSAEADIRAQQLRLDSVGKTALAVAELEQKTKLLNAAEEAGIKITPRIREEIEKLAREYAKLKIAADVAIAIEGVTEALDKQHRGLMDDISLIGKYGDELTRAKNELDALRQAREALPKGEALSPDQEATIRAAAGSNSDASITKRQLENAERIRRQGELDIAQLNSERGALGLNGEALLKYNYIQNEVLKAKREGNELSADEMIRLNEAAEGYARNADELNRLKDNISLARDTIGGFFSDWMQGMRNGGNVFKTFLNSVLDGLNRLANKLMDKVIDNFLNSLGGGSGGGVLGAIGGFLGGSVKANALGGAYGPSGIQRFANGGAFTNSVVNTPTLFRFANGAALGEMGEAGPEAIMPLKRGPDGSLGVQMHGGGNQMVITIRGEEGPMFRPTVTDIANKSAAKVVSIGLNEFNDRLPDRMQEISNDPRMR